MSKAYNSDLPHQAFKGPENFSAVGVKSMRSHVVFTYETREARIERVMSPAAARELARALTLAANFADEEAA